MRGALLLVTALYGLSGWAVGGLLGTVAVTQRGAAPAPPVDPHMFAGRMTETGLSTVAVPGPVVVEEMETPTGSKLHRPPRFPSLQGDQSGRWPLGGYTVPPYMARWPLAALLPPIP